MVTLRDDHATPPSSIFRSVSLSLSGMRGASVSLVLCQG